MLSLYYKDLYTYRERSLYYLDLAQEETDENKKKLFHGTYVMWFNKYNALTNYKWYQKVFYKRES